MNDANKSLGAVRLMPEVEGASDRRVGAALRRLQDTGDVPGGVRIDPETGKALGIERLRVPAPA